MKRVLEPVLRILRDVLRRGEPAGFRLRQGYGGQVVVPRSQIRGEYAPSARLARQPAAPAIRAPAYFSNRLFAAVLLAAGLLRAAAAEPEAQYLSICGLIRDADNLMPLAREGEALPKYNEAKAALEKLQQDFPQWNNDVVRLRLEYLTNRVGKLVGMAVKPAPAGAVKPGGTPPPLEWELQLASLQQQVRQLQSDKSLLETKLREALSVLPSPSDPRELERLQTRMDLLERENALLRATVGQMRVQLNSASPFSALPPAASTNLEYLQKTEQEVLQSLANTGKGKTNAAAGAHRRQTIVNVSP